MTPESPSTPEPEGGYPTVASGALAYMVTTADWTFSPADPMAIGEAEATKWFSTVTDGPYSSYAMAEMAADRRVEGTRRDFLTVHGQMEQHGIGGPRGPHGNACAWKRDLTWHDFTGAFGDQAGWQMIEVTQVDVLP